MRDEISKLKLDKEFMSKKIIKEEKIRNTVEEELKQAQLSHRNAEMEVESLQKQLEDDKKLKDKLLREKETLGKTITGLKETIKALHVEANIHEQIRKKMEASLEDVGQILDESKRKMVHLEKERDKYCHEAKELGDQVKNDFNFLCQFILN